MTQPKEEAAERAYDCRSAEKRARFGDSCQDHYEQAKGNDYSNGVSCPKARAIAAERNDLIEGVRLRMPVHEGLHGVVVTRCAPNLHC
ncbi:MAG TPA: hypothetical protein VMB47_18535 [Candidatus Aquilonibacter sp.]|nr:hypothetical protein [Candidatus Aquilonibacter sp.]